MNERQYQELIKEIRSVKKEVKDRDSGCLVMLIALMLMVILILGI